jgi:hypothetical protein
MGFGGAFGPIFRPAFDPGGGITKPTDIAGCAFWVAARLITGKSDGNRITSWVDFSGNLRSATASTGATYKTNQINGLPILRFATTGEGEKYSIPVIRAGVGGVSAFIVSQRAASQLSGEAWQRLISSRSGGIEDDLVAPSWVTFPTWDGSGNPTAYGPDVRTKHITSGVEIDLTIIGGKQGGGMNFYGDIAEIVIYDIELSALNKTLVLAWLKAIYAIA